MGVCSLRRRKGDHIQMDNRKKTLRLAAYYFTQISRLLLAIFILLIAADLILIGSMFIRRCQIPDGGVGPPVEHVYRHAFGHDFALGGAAFGDLFGVWVIPHGGAAL